ncbi:MAG: hypothetical protein HRT74_05990 [Flavobacteriales bacterium]|nr:hypothetical protein [Flavobacteriales bacterium]
MKAVSKFSITFGILTILTFSSCGAMLDILILMAEDADACCTAYSYDDCEIGTADCYESCQDMLQYSDDYCVCNCMD